MKQALIVFAVASAIVLGCAPEQAVAGSSCSRISDCPLDQVCELPAGVCIPEPPNRFLGSFECTIAVDGAAAGLELSEVVGRIGAQRWVLPSAACTVITKQERLYFVFQGPGTKTNLNVQARLDELASGEVVLGPFLTTGDNAAEMADRATATAFGYSGAGRIALTGTIADGEHVTGYIDVEMIPTVQADARFGAACPRGRADCGRKTAEGGGVAQCTKLASSPVCVGFCDRPEDCSDSTCVGGFCTKACTTKKDCDPSLACVPNEAGTARGCL